MKLVGLFICCLLGFLLNNYGLSAQQNSDHAKNKYARILEEYDIHPPELEYGYPYWYQYDSTPVTAIIFLKKDLENPLEKIDSITYVAELSEDNAREIFNFSGEIGQRPKFYIVPDSTLEWREVKLFAAQLVSQWWDATVLFCGAGGKYCPVYFQQHRFTCYVPPVCGGHSHIFRVMINAADEILCDSKLLEPDSLYIEVFEAYTCDYEIPGRSLYNFYRDLFTKEICTDQIADLQTELRRNDQMEYQFIYEEELLKWTSRLEQLEKYGSLRLLDPAAEIRFKFIPSAMLVGSYYEKLNQVNKGLYLAREWRAKQIGHNSYFELLRQKKSKELAYIHVEFPDLVHFLFCEGGYREWDGYEIEEVGSATDLFQ